MDDQDFEKALAANLARINEWLRFAETKNAALLTFCSAWLVAICSLWSNEKAPKFIIWATTGAAPFIMVAALCAVTSLLPASQNKEKDSTAGSLKSRNLLFHGNIAALELATAQTAFQTRYGGLAGQVGAKNHIADLVTQSVETSQVAAKKFRIFNLGARLVLIALVAAICFAIIGAVIQSMPILP